MPNRRILILDDHPETLELMRDIFTEEQDEVVAVPSVGPDLAEVTAYRPDLAIIDLRLSSSGSKLSGWDIVRLIKAHADMKDMRVLVISADSQELERHVGEAARLDGVQLLSKPFSLDHLLAMVADALRSTDTPSRSTESHDAPQRPPPGPHQPN